MAPFNKFGGKGGREGGKRFGGGGSGNFGGGRKFGGRSDGPRQMHSVVCGQCGQQCEVPFKPTGDRPVFCSSCFKSQAPSNRFAPTSTPKSFEGPAPMHVNRYTPPAATMDGGGISKAQFGALQAKVDKMLSILNAQFPQEEPKSFAPEAEMPEVQSEKKVAKKREKPAKKARAKKK